MTEPSPMFPLGTVLVPGAVLPLRVFEPRYVALVERCSSSGEQFGVALIERGSEVGGGDVRHPVATLAQIVRCEPSGAGRWELVVLGTERIRVANWVEDDPYPRAVVRPWPDETDAEPAGEHLPTARRLLAACFDAAAVRSGRPELAGGPELPESPIEWTWVAAQVAPLTTLDRYGLLAEATLAGRLLRLTHLLEQHLDDVARMTDVGT